MNITMPLTAQQILDGMEATDGGIFFALQGILDVLELNMKTALDELNTRLGYSGKKTIPLPKGYGVIPGTLTESHINHILIGCTTRKEVGSPGDFKSYSDVTIYSVGERIETNIQVSDAHTRAAAIQGILHSFLTGGQKEGALLWRVLEPETSMFLPQPYATHAGVAITYQMTQVPTKNFWTQFASQGDEE